MTTVTISPELAVMLHDLVLAAAGRDPEHWAALKELNDAMAAAPGDTSLAEEGAYRVLRNGGYVTSGDACDIIDQLKPFLRTN